MEDDATAVERQYPRAMATSTKRPKVAFVDKENQLENRNNSSSSNGATRRVYIR